MVKTYKVRLSQRARIQVYWSPSNGGCRSRSFCVGEGTGVIEQKKENTSRRSGTNQSGTVGQPCPKRNPLRQKVCVAICQYWKWRTSKYAKLLHWWKEQYQIVKYLGNLESDHSGIWKVHYPYVPPVGTAIDHSEMDDEAMLVAHGNETSRSDFINAYAECRKDASKPKG